MDSTSSVDAGTSAIGWEPCAIGCAGEDCSACGGAEQVLTFGGSQVWGGPDRFAPVPGPYVCVGDARRASSGHWWDREAMAFFGTRVPDGDGQPMIGGRFFVASHKPPEGSRVWAVHYVTDTGETGTVGHLLPGFRSQRDAVRAARELVDLLG